ENAADGFGVTPEIAEEILERGVDCITTGNHIWDKAQIRDYLPHEPRLLRPINYPEDLPGRGVYLGQTAGGSPVAVINVMGRVFMPLTNDPFRSVIEAVRDVRQRTRVVVVDMHGEATSEKIAMGWHLDGRVSAVVGTHTHVQTADERILPAGTAYITDVGMTGPYDSVIGMDRQGSLARFLHHASGRLRSAKGDPRFCAVVIAVDENTGKASAIHRLMLGQDSTEAGP
ncbi:MAG: YmdB family metallophosphoesterase, partial [Acidobacteriota bacterium]